MEASAYKPQVGDRVRVTLETVVLHSCRVGKTMVEVGGRCLYTDDPAVVSIEKIGPRLPTTPGSRIQSLTGSEWVLTDDHGWVPALRLPLIRAGLEPRAYGTYMFPTSWTVIFAAGAK